MAGGGCGLPFLEHMADVGIGTGRDVVSRSGAVGKVAAAGLEPATQGL